MYVCMGVASPAIQLSLKASPCHVCVCVYVCMYVCMCEEGGNLSLLTIIPNTHLTTRWGTHLGDVEEGGSLSLLTTITPTSGEADALFGAVKTLLLLTLFVEDKKGDLMLMFLSLL